MLRMPDAPALLALCDRGIASTIERDDALLASFDTTLTEDDAATLTVQQREARLLDIWERCFGPMLHAVARCPACAARLDISLPATGLRQTIADEVASYGPTGNDLRAIAACASLDEARSLLLARCGINDTEAAVAALAEANPQADVAVSLDCALCGHQWEAAFEAGAFVWSQVERIAAGLIEQVHDLAQAYHWAEAAILAMPERRRARYLALVRT